MLDRTTDTILANWQPQHEQLFGRHSVHLEHTLHKNPLFSDEALEALLESVEREDYHVNFQDTSGSVPRRRDGEFGKLSGREILNAVKTGNIWINLRAPQKANPAYQGVLDDIYTEFEACNPGLKTFRHTLTILISSPNVRVKYHADVPGQTLWQVRGRKKVFVYPNAAPFISQQALEKLVLGEAHETDLQFQPWFDDHATTFDLNPGQMLHWPHNCPHRVENYDCVNVSLTTEHWTGGLRNAYAVNYANGLLRKIGFGDLQKPEKGLGMLARLGFAGCVKAGGMRKQGSKPYTVDFTVDPSAPDSVRDIKPYEFRH